MSFPTATDLSYTDTGSRVYGYVQQVLTLVNTAATELEITLPTTQYVTSGEPVAGCEQVVVSGLSLATGMPASDPVSLGLPVSTACMPMWSVILDASIVRCSAVPQRDGSYVPEDLDNSFQNCSTDIAVLLLTVESLVAGENLGKIIASVTIGAPMGGMVATTLHLTAALP